MWRSNIFRAGMMRWIYAATIWKQRQVCSVKRASKGPATARHRRRQGHWGAQGMHKRAARIGGKSDITAAPNAGVSIQLRVPRSSVYLSDTFGSRWKRMLHALRRPSILPRPALGLRTHPSRSDGLNRR